MSVGLILGTGMASICKRDEWSEVRTDMGRAYVSLKRIGLEDAVLLQRHGPRANVPPHLVNYRANLLALKTMGVRCVLATSAVGSLRAELPPGSIGILEDFIDFTKRRETTVFDEPADEVSHVDFSEPYCPKVSSALVHAAGEAGVPLVKPLTYVCVDGPRYESPAEVRMFRQWGGDVVGMTGVPEVTMSREMGMCYGALSVVSNYAAGIASRSLSHDEVVEIVTASLPDTWKVLEHALGTLQDSSDCGCGIR